ncbi:MAG: hypothetical protein VX589_20065 [Myxococcota bacterium]|nr:hypothetical protein [Myxococcota bacterium]
MVVKLPAMNAVTKSLCYHMSLILVCTMGCGASEQQPSPSPTTLPACPTFEAAAPNTTMMLAENRLPTLKRILEDELSEVQATALIRSLLQLVRGIESADIETLSSWGDHPATTEIGAGLMAVLDEILGRPQQPQSFQQAVVIRAVDLVATCAGISLLEMMQNLMAAPQLQPLVEQLNIVIQLDAVSTLLMSVDGALNLDGFIIFVDSLLRALVRPNFSVAQDLKDPIAALDVLPVDEPPIAPLLANIDGLLQPEVGVLRPLQNLICCGTHRVPTCAEVNPDTTPANAEPILSPFVHRLLVSPDPRLRALPKALADFVANPLVTGLGDAMNRIMQQLIDSGELRRTFTQLLRRATSPDLMYGFLTDIRTLMTSEMVDEILGYADLMRRGCDADEAP